MEFITIKQFQEQSPKVQNVFLDWWECDYGDLYYYNEDPLEYKDAEIINNNLECDLNGDFKYFKSIGPIPLFTEGQLRKFIEDKKECLLDIKVENLRDDYNIYAVIGWEIKAMEWGKEFGRILFEDYIEAEDLLQLYWKVACSVAKEEVDEISIH